MKPGHHKVSDMVVDISSPKETSIFQVIKKCNLWNYKDQLENNIFKDWDFKLINTFYI